MYSSKIGQAFARAVTNETGDDVAYDGPADALIQALESRGFTPQDLTDWAHELDGADNSWLADMEPSIVADGTVTNEEWLVVTGFVAGCILADDTGPLA